MTLFINALNLSDYIMQKINITETPVYVNGVNEGVSKSGYAIRDRVRARYTASFALKPLPQSVMASIITECAKNECEVTYTSARSGSTVTMTAQCSVGSWNFATTANGERIYSGCVVTLEGN